MNIKALKTILRRDSGMALLTTLLLLLLMSSLMVGFVLLVTNGTKLGGMNDDYSHAYYGAEAGMEQLTSDLGTLFNTNFAPSGAQVNALSVATKEPAVPNIQFQDLNPQGACAAAAVPAYCISFPQDAAGNPLATNATIKSGAYQGMVALAVPYTLVVNARTPNGSEVKLQRTTQTVGIPIFQFGIFSESDLSFFPGPVFGFGGRTHSNGNIFLASGSSLTMGDRVTAVGDIIRSNLANGFPTAGPYNGSVNIAIGPGTPPPTQALAQNQGSITGMPPATPLNKNPLWSNISLGTFKGYLRGGSTAAPQLNLGIVTLGNGTAQDVDIVRRPFVGESTATTAERYYAQASFRVLLSDNSNDITGLPNNCISAGAPFNLADIAKDPATWGTLNAMALKAKMITKGTILLPMAASGAANNNSANPYTTTDGYWIPRDQPIEPGFIKIEIQTAYGYPCGAWQDVTLDVLALGFAGKNINPLTAPLGPAIPPINVGGGAPGQFSQVDNAPAAVPTLTSRPAWTTCVNPHPNAIIRLERIRDNPSAAGQFTNGCGVLLNALNVPIAASTSPYDYWPNMLFDTREGLLRDSSPGVTGIPLGGVMHYIELDAKNLANYLQNDPNGKKSRDSNVADYDFAVYISDRRSNYLLNQTWAGTWPSLSPSLHETGEYGAFDVVNGTTASSCPDGNLNTGEDFDGTKILYTYGEDSSQAAGAYTGTSLGYNPFTNVQAAALAANPSCPAPVVPQATWPGTFVKNANEARENPSFFFRRAVKIVNGNNLQLGKCPGDTPAVPIFCGLTIASENPVYVMGDYNANSAGNGFNDFGVAASILGDAVTFLSNNWNDYNSFYSPYAMASAAFPALNPGKRGAVDTFYRTAVVAGKGINFPQPAGTGQDFGTDGGVHNFLRYLETWGGRTLNYQGSLISLFYNRQAIGTFKCCTTVYSPPTRAYAFDTNFLNPQFLPPRTPLFRDVNTTGFTQLLLPNQ